MKSKNIKKNRKLEEIKIAFERINILFEEAKKAFKEDPKLSNRYVELARKIAMKLRLRIPPEFRKKFCSHCHYYLVPGVNCRVRLQKHKVVYYCFHCRHYMRFPYIREIKEKRRIVWKQRIRRTSH
ncbi:MAG TPA: ribonuclease P protein component 4 [Candidatus Nanoarchaeia archaeon]|nr:ribonuclease P protein component 4 [Candidatus Nanoarchaeia archaeon]